MVATNKLTFTLNGHCNVVEFPDRPMCEYVVREVLTGESYPVFAWLPNLQTIVDIGASYGPFAIRAVATFPGCHVHAYEAHPEAYGYLVKNCAGLPVTCYHGAVTIKGRGENPSIPLYGMNHPLTSSTVPCDGEKIDVPAIHPGELPRKIDLLKIDIEGTEYQILDAMFPILPEITLIYVEFHSGKDREHIENLLLPTHWLYYARIHNHHNGELTYISRNVILS